MASTLPLQPDGWLDPFPSQPFPGRCLAAPGLSEEAVVQGADSVSCLYAWRCQGASEASVPDQGLRCGTEDGTTSEPVFYGGLQSVPRWERGRTHSGVDE